MTVGPTAATVVDYSVSESRTVAAAATAGVGVAPPCAPFLFK